MVLADEGLINTQKYDASVFFQSSFTLSLLPLQEPYKVFSSAV